MLYPEFLRRQAERLKALAAALTDPHAAAALAAVAREIDEKAREIERGTSKDGAA